MKKLNILPLLVALCLLLAFKSANATKDKYTETMQKNIETVYTAQNISDIQNAVNAFERIGDAEKTKWEPFYYASFGYVMMANKEKEANAKDNYLDLALKSLDRAKSIQANDSEITALEGFIHMIRVTVDPASRGQQYSGMAFQAYGKALAMNPENPRALSLMAQMQYGTAQFFGSPTTEACATLNKALEKFDTFKSDNVLAPTWGRRMAEGLKTQCK
jgi:tetratricopeptide (TPR) repeat protein